MKTPLFDFVSEYKNKNPMRLHMPGHKGKSCFGFENLDITEIEGADSLYEAEGIIKESEKNAGALFGARTFYSCEGSSLSIRAMLYLAALHAKENGKTPKILAGRNAHKVFLYSAALLDFDVSWIYPKTQDSYLACSITKDDLTAAIADSETPPTALYVTSPDYLGNTLDIRSLSDICKKHGMLLLVDNAHGAYQKFLPVSRHPIDLGADACCDSAHKTLPVLTGGAYLHVSENAPEIFSREAKNAMALFGSTSPSYLILQSLDLCNAYIENGYREKLSSLCEKLVSLSQKLTESGYEIKQGEPLKLTFMTKSYGYTGREFADILLRENIVCEFSDPDHLVMMFTPEITDEDIERLYTVLKNVEKRAPIITEAPKISIPRRVLSPREAMFSPRKTVKTEDAVGHVLASANVGCPPAVPIVASGELIDENSAAAFRYYGITDVEVVK